MQLPGSYVVHVAGWYGQGHRVRRARHAREIQPHEPVRKVARRRCGPASVRGLVVFLGVGHVFAAQTAREA